MYCTNCGAERPDQASVCALCGQRVQFFPPPQSVPNYLVGAIVATLCCCLPFGVVALVYSAQVGTKLAAGDFAGAQASSQKARNWVIISVIAGVISMAGFAALSFLDR